jgi:hypothetical protein
MKEYYTNLFVGKELQEDDKFNLENKGFIDIKMPLSPSDTKQFKKHINEDDEIELISKDGKVNTNVVLKNTNIIKIKTGYYEARFTLVLKQLD